MTRIRNARKAVELDDSALQDFEVEQGRLDESPALGLVSATEIDGDDASARPDSPSKSATDEILSDSLLAGCRKCKWVMDPDMTITFGGKGFARGAEEFRALRSRLYRVRKQQNLKTILVSSALPAEGRSFVATNLAQVLAIQAGCRVLLIDGDLRAPRLHSAFGTSSSPGFSDYLLEEAGELEIMQRGREEGLVLIPSGRSVHEGQTELIANGRLEYLIRQVEPSFEWIIIDSPATILSTDSGLLANCCDGVLLVVRSHSTPFDVVRKARERFREESLVGVVLNKIETTVRAK